MTLEATQVRACSRCRSPLLWDGEDWRCPIHGRRITVVTIEGMFVPYDSRLALAAESAVAWLNEHAGEDWWTGPIPEHVAADLTWVARFITDAADK